MAAKKIAGVKAPRLDILSLALSLLLLLLLLLFLSLFFLLLLRLLGYRVRTCCVYTGAEPSVPFAEIKIVRTYGNLSFFGVSCILVS